MPTISELLEKDHGTLVIWEDFDVIDKSNNGQVYSTLCDYKSKIAQYVGLIFHRYIGAKGGKAIVIDIPGFVHFLFQLFQIHRVSSDCFFFYDSRKREI